MIKILLILLLSSTYVLSNSPQLGLQATDGSALDLIELKTKAFVEGPYAEIQYIQTYKNSKNHTVETEFHFPQIESSIFHKFEAIFLNQTLVGEIIHKETAKELSESNTKKGNTVAYFERSQDAPDFINIKIGNIAPNETVKIVFSVIQPLETIINKFYELKLPAVFTDSSETFPYKEWSIQVQIKSKTPFAILSNPTHNLKPELSEQPSSKTYKAIWNATIIPNKDFVIYFGPENLAKPEAILATLPQNPNNHMLLINFVPDLTTIQPQLAQDILEFSPDAVSALKKMALEYDIEHAQVEFIFIIDRSNSMEGARIENLRKALIKFLNVIPKTSYFNIISFGSRYQLYSTKSVLNSPQALEEALQWINTIQADMGGTESLEDLLESWDENYPGTDLLKIVMILTGGDILEPDLITFYIFENSDKMRFCSVGIGAGASEHFVRSMAIAGKCRSELVLENEDIGDKALYIVQAAISQYIMGVKFGITCFNDKNRKVYSEQGGLDLLVKDQSFNNFIYLENIPHLKYCQASLSYFNSLKNKIIKEELDIQASEIERITDFWHKVAYERKIREFEQLVRMRDTWKPSTICMLSNQISHLSTKYQVLSDYTSFLAVTTETALSINMTNVKSADYTVSQPNLIKVVQFGEDDDDSFAGAYVGVDCGFEVTYD